ncbi:MAG: hypothetical protein ACT6FE_08250, partial [Methanosarcinaceae archaeon]
QNQITTWERAPIDHQNRTTCPREARTAYSHQIIDKIILPCSSITSKPDGRSITGTLIHKNGKIDIQY